jgi:hypothetical protein
VVTHCATLPQKRYPHKMNLAMQYHARKAIDYGPHVHSSHSKRSVSGDEYNQRYWLSRQSFAQATSTWSI